MVQSRRPRAGVRLPTAEVSASPTDQLHNSLAAVGPRRPNAAGYADQVLTGVWFRVEGCDNGSRRFAFDSHHDRSPRAVVPRALAHWVASSTMAHSRNSKSAVGLPEHAATWGTQPVASLAMLKPKPSDQRTDSGITTGRYVGAGNKAAMRSKDSRVVEIRPATCPKDGNDRRQFLRIGGGLSNWQGSGGNSWSDSGPHG
jgi:hypothetical protein